MSGPVVLNASRHWLRARLEGRDTRLTSNFCPGEGFERVERKITEAGVARPRAGVQNAVTGMVPASVAQALLQRLGIDGATRQARLSRGERRTLVHAIVSWPLPVVESRGYNYAEATAGGVVLDEVDPASMQSRRAPGVFLVGEMLDVDGRIGGFNFQWAWSSGYVAGAALARLRP
jgi:predicted Rossmann fold flavoprotein